MRRQKTIFLSLWGITLCWVLLHECGLLPGGYLPTSASLDYGYALLCCFTAIVGSYLACRLFALKGVKEELYDAEGNPLADGQRKWQNRRLALLAVAILPSAFCYYALPQSPTPLYCMLLALAASLLCWPKA